MGADVEFQREVLALLTVVAERLGQIEEALRFPQRHVLGEVRGSENPPGAPVTLVDITVRDEAEARFKAMQRRQVNRAMETRRGRR
ncbi:hypothetical protein SEA_SPEEDDEMON_710 [Gordonia phage SpeedDemon]|uniref:Uncharacterized protein n=1 Tax=Gordonia phage Bantam TaxID=1887641 RepID=A0A1B3AYC8_9CAUD|nr:hypothetical protein BIZ77_gp110 [Gordonia phage Bantam]AOE43758.1 hypothetical protein SEA_BANTAM_69 [Gordonia phage Bantam]QNL30521.1 hypothetical protein SEA_SPEEDDEMON_710 [Gordonia phage SpeedDemon]